MRTIKRETVNGLTVSTVDLSAGRYESAILTADYDEVMIWRPVSLELARRAHRELRSLAKISPELRDYYAGSAATSLMRSVVEGRSREVLA